MMKKVRGLGMGKTYPGKLFVVEGCDGSGKSTQVYLLKKWLESKGYIVFFTEWNSSELIKESTKKAKKKNLLTPTTFSLMHASDFADRYEKLILPHLRAGYIVLCDRYIYTAFSRDMARGCDPDWARNLYDFAVKPSVTFYFQAPLETSISRILAGRPELKYHEAGMDMGWSTDPVESFKIFQGIIKQNYDNMIDDDDFTVIDATQTVEKQQNIVRDLITKELEGYTPPFKRKN
jgi:dTMP kinase